MLFSGRVLVLIVAYRAERHIASVFERIPRELYNNESVRFLCIDDASSDETASVAADWVQKHQVDNVTVLRNPLNQGYGGNQKLGYRAAIDGDYDFVILLHGDGQYAPELLPKFIETWEQTGADVVLGSRMASIRSAREGGMPWYKVVGNRVLTTVQNRLTGQALSEYHTGYRGYSVAFLRRVPFELNTNEFHFDTEILLQAVEVGARIEEFAIPTHYGDEVCHVNGMKYALDVLKATARFKLHRWGMLCSLKYRDLHPHRYPDKTKTLYSSHIAAIETVRRMGARSVLDIGCGSGHVARECERFGARVTGLDVREPDAGAMSEFHLVDLELEPPPVDALQYDAVLALDVLEHLNEPEGLLLGLRNNSRADRPGRVVLSTPNVAFAGVRLNLLMGRFNYGQRGILDVTHKRLFTRQSLCRMLEDCGYRIESFRGIGVPFETVIGGRIGRLLGAISDRVAKLWPSLFAFQFLVICRPLPAPRRLLRQAQQYVLSSRPDRIPAYAPALEEETEKLLAELADQDDMGVIVDR